MAKLALINERKDPSHNKRREELSIAVGSAEGRKSSGKKGKTTPSDTAYTAVILSPAQKRGVQKQHGGRPPQKPHTPKTETRLGREKDEPMWKGGTKQGVIEIKEDVYAYM
eukprot:11270737-Ditylum_brightwellii.AAC.1